MRTGFVSIKTKLLVLFIVFSVIPMGFVATHLYRDAEERIRTTTLEQLQVLTQLKSLEIERFFELARLNLISAQDFVVFKSNIPVLIRLASRKSDPRFVAAKKMLDIQLIKFAADHRINDIDIIGLDGRVIYSTDDEHLDNESHFKDVHFIEGKKGIYFSDIQRNDEGGPNYFLRASAPLSDLDNRPIGVVAFELKTDTLFSLIQGTTGLGATGETMLGKRVGDSVVFLNPLRHDADAVLRKTARVGEEKAYAIQQAACGKSGSGITCDYRGAQVVAAWKYIPSVKWGIVTKIDSSEALAPIEELRNNMLAAGGLALSLGILFSMGLAHSITKPLRALKDGAEQLGQGNLDYRIDVSSNDEISALSTTFNKMAVNLQAITSSREQMRHQANHDALTGLPNRLLLEDRLEQAMLETTREGRMMAVMFLDLDGFKGVNDDYGHDMGDLVLKEVAGRLCYCVRKSDTVARIGGDEFVIILLKIKDPGNLDHIAGKILHAIREEFKIAGITIRIGVSIGASVFPNHSQLPEELLQLADDAMYRAKKAGKNTFRLAAAAETPEVRRNGIQ